MKVLAPGLFTAVLAAACWSGMADKSLGQATSEPRPVVVIPYYVPYDYWYGPYWYGPPYWYPYYPYRYYPPVFLPAETLYGPGPVMRMMGVSHWFQSPSTGSSSASRERPAPVPRDAIAHQAAKPVAPRLAPESAVTQAWKYIGNGDAAFAAGDYQRANQRYAQAVKTSPAVAEAWLRQGLAQAALGNYELAVAAIRESLQLKPDLPKGRFRIWELFGDDRQAARQYVEGFVKKAENDPKDANLAFLAGVHLYFEEQRQQAEKYIARAVEAGLGDRPFVKAFLPGQQPPADNNRRAEF